MSGNGEIIRRLSRIDLELPQKSTKGDARALVPDTNANRAILVVNAHRYDGALEARVGHSRHCQQQLAGQETRLFSHDATMGRSVAAGKP